MLTVAASIFSVSTVSLKMVQEKKSGEKEKKKALVTYLKRESKREKPSNFTIL